MDYDKEYEIDEKDVWFGLLRTGTMATHNLLNYMNTILANADCLKRLCGNSVFYGLDVASVLLPLHKQAEGLLKNFKVAQNGRFDYGEHSLRFTQAQINEAYNIRKQVRVLACTVGIPTKQLTARELLDFNRRS